MSSCSKYYDNKIKMVDTKGEEDLTPHRPFTVNDLTSLRQDRDYVDFEIAQSKGSGQYVLKDYNDNHRENMIERATENATINFRDGNGTNMKNIDDDSKTLFSKVKSEKKHQKQLFERPFKSMPFLGRGVHFVDDESFLHSPEVTRVSRQCSSLAGVFIENQFTPLVPSLSEHVQNHYHIIPEDNCNKWVRGGIPTRDLVKDIDYFSRCSNDDEIKQGLVQRKKYLHK
tara:strand:+ start:1402 stop:2085 length:684 start_codon:yes stop_codon:yes gene_type:complete